MSETVQYIGKLKPFSASKGESLTDQLLRFAKSKNEDISDFPTECENEAINWMKDRLYEQFLIIDGVLFETEIKYSNTGDIFFAKVEANGDISFILEFYNGGCCFQEAIEIALNKMIDNE